MSDKVSVFAQISKVDAAKQEVWGVLTAAVPDRQGEILDYGKSKPYFEEWSNSQKEASGGKSLGNVRLMHGAKAIGKVIQIDYDDANERISIGSKITDPEAFKLAEEGVLTGYSVGGSYVGAREEVQHEKLGKLLRYVAKPQEASLVDRPAVPTATYSMVKADGSIEERPLVGRQPRQVWACGAAEGCEHELKSDAMKCDGSPMLEKRQFSQRQRDKAAKSGAAMPGGGYPIENKKDLSNAIQAFGRAKNPSAVKAHIKSRAKALGATDMLPEDWSKAVMPESLQKCLYQLASLAGALTSIEWVHQAEEMEAAQEGDNSTVPDKLKTAITALYDALVTMAEEEEAEWTSDEGDELAMAVSSTLEKIGSKPDRLRELLAKRAEEEGMETKELQKIVGATEEKLAKVIADGLEKIGSRVEGVETSVKTITERLEKVEKATPAPGGPVLRAVEKSADNAIGNERTEAVPEDTHGLVKLALRQPIMTIAGANRPR